MTPKLLAVLALAALAAAPALAPATATSLAAPEGPAADTMPGGLGGGDVPALDPVLAGPVTGATYGGPAAAVFIPPGAPTGAPVPGVGLLFTIQGYSQLRWELHAGGFKWLCNTHFGRGTVYIDGLNQPVGTGTCTGRFGQTGVDYVVSFSQASYATVPATLGGIITAAPMVL